MAVVNTGLNEAGLKPEFFQRLSQVQTLWQDLCTTIKSNKDSEKYAFMGATPNMREWGTGRLAKGLRTESYSVENLKYEATLEVDRDKISDDQTGQIKLRVAELASRAGLHKDNLVAQLLINGASAGYHSYDGVPFFGATHESGASGAQDNDLTSAIVDKDAPTASEFRSALSTVLAALLNLKDDRGEPASESATGLIAVVPPSMLITANEAVAATVATGGQNVLSGVARIVAFPRLTDTDTWYLLKTDVPVRPLIFQDRCPLEFAAVDRHDDASVFKTEKYLYGVRARYRITYGYWQYAMRHVFTTAA